MISNDMLRYFSKNTTRIYGKDALREKRPVNQAGPPATFPFFPLRQSPIQRQNGRKYGTSVNLYFQSLSLLLRLQPLFVFQ